MIKDSLWQVGMSVDLIIAPGDIRGASVRQVADIHITLNQTIPPLDLGFLKRPILLTFTEGPPAARFGCKAKVMDIGPRHGGTEDPYIVVETGEAMTECDLRKYPRFNPGLFDQVRISFGETVLEIEDISAGGARGICRQGDYLPHLTKGDMIRLTVAIGEQNHHVDAQVMRIRHAVEDSAHWELAVAFMEWNRHVAYALGSPPEG